jgi:hypothetical protein
MRHHGHTPNNRQEAGTLGPHDLWVPNIRRSCDNLRCPLNPPQTYRARNSGCNHSFHAGTEYPAFFAQPLPIVSGPMRKGRPSWARHEYYDHAGKEFYAERVKLRQEMK